jgi:hypothetical protein
VEEFAALDVIADLDAQHGLVLIPRGPATPTFGHDDSPIAPLPQLAVAVTIGARDSSWALTLNQRGTRMASVAAPCDRRGAAAVAQLAIEFNIGLRGNPFAVAPDSRRLNTTLDNSAEYRVTPQRPHTGNQDHVRNRIAYDRGELPAGDPTRSTGKPAAGIGTTSLKDSRASHA